MSLRPGAAAALAATALALAGCVGLGAKRLPIDRLDYTESLRQSDRTQILSNIVALRYGEGPSFLAVGSVVSQYVRESYFKPDPRIPPYGNDPAAELTAKMLFRETPTITYTPLSGEKLVRALLEPIPPPTLMSMAEAGWEADQLFALTVRSINGVRNGSRAPLFAQAGDPAFAEVLGALRRLQADGALTFRLFSRDKAFAVHAHLRPDLTNADRADVALLQHDLGMHGESLSGEVTIVFSAEAETPDELAIATRSMLEVLQVMSLGVDVAGEGRFESRAPIHVHSGPKRPQGAYTAIQRGGRWFWIDADDAASQRALLLAEILMEVNEGAEVVREPVLTIPVG